MSEEHAIIKKKTNKSVFLKIWNFISTLIVVVVALLAVALVGVRIFGFTPYSILSPSMTPEYQVGDLVYVKSVNPEKIQTGDVITFVANDDLLLVTHRVDEINRENSLIYTKGDTNQERDAVPVHYENVVGVVKFSLPKLGYISNYFSSPSGRYAGIAIIFVLILLFILPELFVKDKSKNKGEPDGTGS